jgi:hypothetical protein
MSKGQVSRGSLAGIAVFTAVVVLCARIGWSQELGGAGTIQGTVKDPTGGVMAAVIVELSNPLTGLRRTTTTDTGGRFVFRNLPPNSYHVSIAAQGFAPYAKDVNVRSAVPIELEVPLALAGATATVDVVGHAEDLVERDPTAHTDIDQSLISKLPMESVAAGLNQVITLLRRACVRLERFFHPLATTRRRSSIDNQPVTGSKSRVFQPDLTGRPVDGGDHRLHRLNTETEQSVVHIVTKSGLDRPKPTGLSGTFGCSAALRSRQTSAAPHTVGTFFRSADENRQADPPEFDALHDTALARP